MDKLAAGERYRFRRPQGLHEEVVFRTKGPSGPSGGFTGCQIKSGGNAAAGREAKVVASWPIHDASRNFPMALDKASGRVFVATRVPARRACD